MRWAESDLKYICLVCVRAGGGEIYAAALQRFLNDYNIKSTNGGRKPRPLPVPPLSHYFCELEDLGWITRAYGGTGGVHCRPALITTKGVDALERWLRMFRLDKQVQDAFLTEGKAESA